MHSSLPRYAASCSTEASGEAFDSKVQEPGGAEGAEAGKVPDRVLPKEQFTTEASGEVLGSKVQQPRGAEAEKAGAAVALPARELLAIVSKLESSEEFARGQEATELRPEVTELRVAREQEAVLQLRDQAPTPSVLRRILRFTTRSSSPTWSRRGRAALARWSRRWRSRSSATT